jgi:putative copper resistance protein D
VGGDAERLNVNDMGSMQMPTPFTWGHLDSSALSLTTTVILLAVSGLYLAGAARYPKLAQGRRWSPKRTTAFLGGIAVVFLATESVVGVYDMTLFTDHMVQHLMLIMVAAGLFAMGAPLELACTTTAGPPGKALNALVDSKLGELVGQPIFGFLAYALFIPVTHLTSLFNLMLSHMWVHHLEQLGFLFVGYLFWRPVVAIEPCRHPLAPGLRIIYLALAVPVDTITGLALVMSDHELFSTYAAMHRSWGPSLLTDLRTGGAVMWIGGDLLMLLAMIPVAVLWMRDEDSKVGDLDARLDAERAAAGLPFTAQDASSHEP